jgi:hypothetical protein
MTRTTISLTATTCVLFAAAAAPAFDPLRCEAVAMRKDGQRYECLGRCERRHSARVADAAVEAAWDTCREACEVRFLAAMEQLDERDICSDPQPLPDPIRCQSRLLRIDATRLVCRSQCERHVGGDGCGQSCDDRCARAAERVLTRTFCAGYAGRATCEAH